MRIAALVVASVLALSGCLSAAVSAPGRLGEPQASDDIMMGGQFREPWLSAALREAARHPLGSRENPVRADMPSGQRAYLARLRCADGRAPVFERQGNLGAGVFGSIVDAYDLRCPGSTPQRTSVMIDMYFDGYVETKPVSGFTITPP